MLFRSRLPRSHSIPVPTIATALTKLWTSSISMATVERRSRTTIRISLQTTCKIFLGRTQVLSSESFLCLLLFLGTHPDDWHSRQLAHSRGSVDPNIHVSAQIKDQAHNVIPAPRRGNPAIMDPTHQVYTNPSNPAQGYHVLPHEYKKAVDKYNKIGGQPTGEGSIESNMLHD